ncbi:ranBP2-like and GRIP domain-containing protein 3 isoform X1 [Homarus americanus]|uniref:ranBP2-like and GRIP domain-containing protein 3 isoform X1 n=1 Tax=Homarus americanus TaxID=6706 RepID=UPI001C467031|nr:ranBP2-like and GRIP domain-containing protein 3 isoform X1 [Homarus americanus]
MTDNDAQRLGYRIQYRFDGATLRMAGVLGLLAKFELIETEVWACILLVFIICLCVTHSEVYKRCLAFFPSCLLKLKRHLRGYNFARLYFDIKEYDSARRYLSEFLTVRPKASDAHRLMGQILELQDNKVMALEAYKTSYHLGQIQKDLVLKICDIYTHIDADKSVKLYWAEEGNRLYPHHETVIKLQESLITGSDAQSREDLESLYLDGINARPLLVTLHINLLLLYKRWGADDKSKINEGYQHACRVEAGKAFIDSLEWYQALIDTMEDYQNYEDVSHDKEFQMNYLAALERLVYLTLASSSGTALLSPCTLNDAATFLKRFDQKLTTGLAVIGPGTQFGQVMAGQLYLNMAIFLLSNAQKECLTPTSITAGALLFHACRFQTTEIDRQSKSWKSRDQFWYKLACHRLSQAAHVLEHMASTETDKKTYLEKVKVRCSNKEVQGNIYKTVFGATLDNKKSVLQSTLENKDQSFFLKDQGFIDASLSYPEPDQVKEWDNVVGSMYCASLGDLVWLCLQQTPMNLNPQPYYSFTLFEGLPFYSSRINTGAAETLCHIDLLAFLAATVYCQIAALKEAHGPPPASLPTVIASALNTVEQADWWTAAYTLFTNRVHQSYMKQRLTLQRGLEVIRVQGNHGVALPLLAHLAQCFTNWATAAEGDGSTNNEIDALKDRAELYWQEALQLCHKTSRNLPIVVPRNPLFVVQYVNLTSEEVAKIEMEGKYFLAMRLVHAGKQQEAIQALGELKSPEASFQRALLYKEQGQALLGEGNVESVTSEKRSQHTTLLTQARDTFYLTLDRLRMPGVDRGHPLHTKLNQQLQDVERRLSHMALDKSVSRQQEDDTESISDASQSPSPDLENVITNLPQTPHLFSTPYTEKKSSARITRQEARSSRERLDAQVRALSEVQENTLRNMEEQNAALKAQNEALRNFCTTMADEFKENASLYRSMLDQNKSLSQEVYASIIKEMKQIHSTLLVETKDLQSTVKDLQGQVHAMAVDLGEVRAMKSTVKHSEVTEVKASDEQVPVDLPATVVSTGLYGGYINYYNQQAVPSPLMPTPGLFGNPPFFPPSTMPEQSFSMSTSMSEGATISTLAQTNTSMVTPALASPASITVKDPVTSQSGMFSTQNWNLATTGASNNRLPPDASPPAHAFQIAMPPVSNALTPPPRSVPGESLSHTLPCSTTAGLLANVPPPLYSAVTPDSSPVRGESHIQSLSTVMSTEGLSTASDNLVAPSAASGSRDSSLTYTGAFTSGGLSEPKISPIKNKEAADEDTDRYIEDDHDPCPDFKPVVPLPEKVEVRTGEEDEEVLFEERAKLFRFVDKEWRERGTGVMKLLHNPSQGSARVLMRRDQTHKICANHLVTENIDIQPMKKNDKVWIWAAQDFADESLRMEKFCCRFKTVEIATSFRDAFVKAKEIARNKEEMDKIQQEVNKPPQESSNQTLTTATKPTSLAEMFKPTAGSWSCSTCLVLNTQEKTKCAACETLNPNAPKAKEPVEETLTPFASFKFTPSSKTEGGASAYPVGFRFGGTTPLSSVVKSTPVSTSTTTAIGFQFGVSSVSIVPVTASFPVASTSSLATVTTDSLKDSSKMSLPGFTFTSSSTALSFKPETTEGSQPKPQEDKKKVSIFAEFSFGTNANNTPTTGFAFSTPSTDIKEEEDNTGVPASTGGPIGGDTSGSMLTFGSVAATSASAGLFTTKVPQAFEPKTLFGISTGSPSKDDSDDKVEEYEPQVDFQPVIPMPDLVEVKTGEEGEEKLFCERAKLYRYDKDSKEWKERGVGELKVLKNNSSGKVRVLMRRDQIHKVCANHFLTADMKLSPMKVSDKAWIWAAHDYADQEMKEEQFAARFKTQELALAFKEAFEKAQHSLSTSTTAETTAPVPPPQDTVTSTTKSLADMFRPAAGSWECGVCLVRNTAASKLCVSCSSKKPCSEPSNEDVTDATIESKPAFSFSISKTPSQSSSGFMFGTSDSKQSFSFGIPQTSKATTETTSLSTISFGVPNNSTQDSAAPSENKPAFSFGCSYDQFNKPFNFTWQPIQGTSAGSVDSSSSSTTSTFSSSSFSATGPIVIPKSTREDPTTPTKDEKSGFVFGSPGKYEFSFTGIKAKSPRSRNTSYCESEDGVVEEDDGDHLYFEPVVPLPEKVEVVTGEEDEDVLYVHRAKLFRHVAGEWKERGLGDIKILSHKQNGKIRLLMRREQVHKLCLNHTLNIDIEFRKKDDKTYYWAAVDYTESTPQNETFAVRFKTPEIALDFIKAVNDAKVKLGGSPVELPATTISSPVKLEDNTREKSPKAPAMPTPSQFTPPDSTTPITSASTKPAGYFLKEHLENLL